MRNVTNNFKILTKKIKYQDLKCTLLEENSNIKLNKIHYRFDGKFFKTIMREIEFSSKLSIKDKNINVKYGLLINNSFEYVDLGDFYLKDLEEDKDSEESVYTGYDKMINFMKKYNSEEMNLPYPCELGEFLLRMCEICSVQMYTTDFYNSNLILNEDYFINQNLTYRDILEKIAQSTLTTIFIKENKLYLCKIGTEKQELDTSFLSNFILKEKFGPVNALVLGRGEVEENIEAVDPEDIEINGRHEIRFDENELLDDKRSQVINDMFSKIKGFYYYTFEGSDLGVMWLEPCDLIVLKDRNNVEYLTYYMSADVTINTGIKSNINNDLLDETTTEYAVTTKEEKQILKVERYAKKNEGKINDLIEQQTEFGNKITSVEQNIDSINQTVSSFTNFTKTIEGKTKILLEDALETNILKLVLYAENTENGIYPSEDLYPNEDLYPENAGNEFTIIVENEDKTETKEFYYNSTYPLEEYDGTHDQLVIEFDKEKGCCSVKVLAYIEEIAENVFTVLETPKEIILDDNLQFTLFKGNNYISVEEYQDWKIEATYIFNNELNDLYATQVYMSSIIKQLADEILLEVSKKVGDDELIAKINLTPETIKIIATKLALEGYTTINGGFSIDEEGNASIANGAVIINKDGIRMADGTSILGGKGLLSNLTFEGIGIVKTASVGSYYQVGFMRNSNNGANFKSRIDIDAYIPEGFEIEKAVVTISHFPMEINYNGTNYGKGFARGLNIFYSNTQNRMLQFNIGSEYQGINDTSLTQIANALEKNWTPNIEENKVDNIVTKDIKSSLHKGINRITIQSAEEIPAYDTGNNSQNLEKGMVDYLLKTGMVSAFLDIYGFMKPISEEEK